MVDVTMAHLVGNASKLDVEGPQSKHRWPQLLQVWPFQNHLNVRQLCSSRADICQLSIYYAQTRDAR